MMFGIAISQLYWIATPLVLPVSEYATVREGLFLTCWLVHDEHDDKFLVDYLIWIYMLRFLWCVNASTQGLLRHYDIVYFHNIDWFVCLIYL